MLPNGARIRALRSKKGMTLDELAQAIGTNKSYIWSLEHGKINAPSVTRIMAVARALDVTVDELCAEEIGDKQKNAEKVLIRKIRELDEKDRIRIEKIVDVFRRHRS